MNILNKLQIPTHYVEILKKLQKKNHLEFLDEYTTVNTAMHPAALTWMLKDPIEQIAKPVSAEKLMGERQGGIPWRSEVVLIRLFEGGGSTVPYSDRGTSTMAHVNETSTSVGHHKYEIVVDVGDLENEQFSNAFLNPNATTGNDVILRNKTTAAIRVLNRTFNNLAFWGLIKSPAGNDDHDIHGILTSPKLPPMATENKQLTAMTFDEGVTFFNKYFTILGNVNGGFITALTPVKVGLTPEGYFSMNSKLNPMGVSVLERIQKTYPNMQFVICPELTKATNDKKDVAIFVASVPEIGNPVLPTISLYYSKRAAISRIEYKHTSMSFKFMEGCCGITPNKSSLVQRVKFT